MLQFIHGSKYKPRSCHSWILTGQQALFVVLLLFNIFDEKIIGSCFFMYLHHTKISFLIGTNLEYPLKKTNTRICPPSDLLMNFSNMQDDFRLSQTKENIIPIQQTSISRLIVSHCSRQQRIFSFRLSAFAFCTSQSREKKLLLMAKVDFIRLFFLWDTRFLLQLTRTIVHFVSNRIKQKYATGTMSLEQACRHPQKRYSPFSLLLIRFFSAPVSSPHESGGVSDSQSNVVQTK